MTLTDVRDRWEPSGARIRAVDLRRAETPLLERACSLLQGVPARPEKALPVQVKCRC